MALISASRVFPGSKKLMKKLLWTEAELGRLRLKPSRLSPLQVVAQMFTGFWLSPLFSAQMDGTMFQLRSFVHQRLYAAAEEILGEVERAITAALHRGEVHRFKEEAACPAPQLAIQQSKSGVAPISDVCV